MIGSGKEFVVSGISGRFPKASNIDELWNNILIRKNVITDPDRRVAIRSGKVDNVDKFDAEFFGVSSDEVNLMDPRLRLILELVQEAIIDAGVSPVAFKGTSTGVFIGASGENTSSLASRISSAFDLTGPSQTTENGYADSSEALHQALLGLKTGLCEAAIVAGVQINPVPLEQAQLSPDGKCRAFDADANGTVQSEAVVVIYLTSKDVAKRQYAGLVNTAINTSDSKTPAEQFLATFYRDSDVKAEDVAYVEANGTGIKSEDEKEANALAAVLTAGVAMGSVKSHLGHAGPAAGVVGLAKLLLIHRFGQIPASQNFDSPNPAITALINGGLTIPSQKAPVTGKYVALNSIAADGTNVHVLLSLSPKEPAPTVLTISIPVLVPISGRTEAGVEQQMRQIMLNTKNAKFVSLVHEAYKISIPQHPIRGYILATRTESKSNVGKRLQGAKSPMWFVFTGLGNQWVGMTRDMARFKTFNNSIKKSAQILQDKENYDLMTILESKTPAHLDVFKNSIAAITTVQIGLTDLFNSVGISPDGIIGYSTGECCSGYSDGCFTHEEALLVSFSRARAFSESNLPPGIVAAVKLSWDQAKQRCPNGIYPAIHNSGTIVSISGPPRELRQFITKLSAEKIFAQEVKSAAYGFHSPLVAGSEKLMRELLGKIITEPKERSRKWLSTSIPAEKWGSDLAKYSSVDYHVNNALSPVYFFATLKHVPKNSIVVEMGPHGFMQSVIRQGVAGSALILALMDKEEDDNTKFYLNALGKLYLHGVDLDAGKLYEPVQFPVDAGTPSLSPMVKWDHSRSWSIPEIKI